MLRPPQMPDYADWSELREASQAHLMPFEPQWTIDELSRGAFRERVKRYQREAKTDQSYAFLIFSYPAPRALVGGITLSNVRRGVAQAAAVGYWVGLKHTRKGYATGALRAVSRFAFEELRVHRLEAACMPANAASLHTLERGKFRREGIAKSYLKINGKWEDHVLFGLTCDDWVEGQRE